MKRSAYVLMSLGIHSASPLLAQTAGSASSRLRGVGDVCDQLKLLLPTSPRSIFATRGACSLVALATIFAGLASVAGCPQDPVVLDTQVLVEPPAVPGLYWVEPADGKFVFYRLPEDRNDPGTWTSLPIDPPDWYTAPGVYDEADDGTWTRTTTGDGLTLDEVLQLYDPAPEAPGAGTNP